MDTLPLPVGPPVNTPTSSFVSQQHPHPSSMIDNVSSTSSAHSDGVWVAPPEQPSRQSAQASGSFSHLQPQRSTSNFSGQPQSRLNGKMINKNILIFHVFSVFSVYLDEHLHDYNHPSSQQMYPPNRLDDPQGTNRSQAAPTFSSRPQGGRPGYSPS